MKLGHMLMVMLCSLSLAACTAAPRVFQEASAPAPNAQVQKLFLVTHHPLEDILPGNATEIPSFLGDKRRETVRYLGLDISIPAGHTPGQIEWPDRRTGPANARTDFAVLDTDVIASAPELRRAIHASARNRTDPVFLFVHGYNNTAPDATYRVAQILQDFDTPLPGIVFAWPSAARASGYLYDRDSVLFARDDLVDLLRDLTQGTSRGVVIMAHSMGSQLVMEALRQIRLKGDTALLRRIETLVLMSPDIDVDVFRRQAKSIEPHLPTPFMIFINQDDRILRLSSFLTGRRARVGGSLSPDDVEDLPVTVIDLSTFSTGSAPNDHLLGATSPEVIRILRRLEDNNALQARNVNRWLRLEDLDPKRATTRAEF